MAGLEDTGQEQCSPEELASYYVQERRSAVEDHRSLFDFGWRRMVSLARILAAVGSGSGLLVGRISTGQFVPALHSPDFDLPQSRRFAVEEGLSGPKLPAVAAVEDRQKLGNTTEDTEWGQL